MVLRKKDEPTPPTIFTGYVIDENDKLRVQGFNLRGITSGFNGKLTFNETTEIDSKGYYYLEVVILKDTGGIEFQPTEGSVYSPAIVQKQNPNRLIFDYQVVINKMKTKNYSFDCFRTMVR